LPFLVTLNISRVPPTSMIADALLVSLFFKVPDSVISTLLVAAPTDQELSSIRVSHNLHFRLSCAALVPPPAFSSGDSLTFFSSSFFSSQSNRPRHPNRGVVSRVQHLLRFSAFNLRVLLQLFPNLTPPSFDPLFNLVFSEKKQCVLPNFWATLF